MRNVVFTIATLGNLVACATDTTSGSSGGEATDRHRRDAGVSQSVDASPSTTQDASTTSGGDSGGTVSCYSEGFPSTTCTLPVHCCFSNYSAQHNGACTTNACAWGTISCDGPEDCASGQHCCATRSADADGVTTGYQLACQSGTCAGEELCHPDGAACSNGGTCVSTYGANNDLPRTLSICR